MNDTERYDFDVLADFVRIRSEKEFDDLKNIRSLFRWLAIILIKSMSKDGTKKEDWLFPDEVEEQKKTKEPLTPAQIRAQEEWFRKMDEDFKNKNLKR